MAQCSYALLAITEQKKNTCKWERNSWKIDQFRRKYFLLFDLPSNQGQTRKRMKSTTQSRYQRYNLRLGKHNNLLDDYHKQSQTDKRMEIVNKCLLLLVNETLYTKKKKKKRERDVFRLMKAFLY